MCHPLPGSNLWLKEMIARELLAEGEREEAEGRTSPPRGRPDEQPSFLEEGDTDVDIVTGGAREE